MTSAIATLIIAQVVIGTANALGIKALLNYGISPSELIFWRGLGCSLLAGTIGVLEADRLFPKQPGLQAIRFITAGLGLLLITTSYSLLQPSTASLASKLDVPILLLVGGYVGFNVKHTQKYCAATAIICFLAGIILTAKESISISGVGVAATGALLIAIGYLFLRYSFRTDSIAATILVPSLACVTIGGLSLLVTRQTLSPLSSVTGLALGLGGLMYLLYRLNSVLYRKLPMLGSEIATMLVPLALIPLEAHLFGMVPPLVYALSLTLATSLMIFSLFIGAKEYGYQR